MAACSHPGLPRERQEPNSIASQAHLQEGGSQKLGSNLHSAVGCWHCKWQYKLLLTPAPRKALVSWACSFIMYWHMFAIMSLACCFGTVPQDKGQRGVRGLLTAHNGYQQSARRTLAGLRAAAAGGPDQLRTELGLNSSWRGCCLRCRGQKQS